MKREKMRKEPLVVAICGVKNSGKTTCMEQVISILNNRGYHIAAIKHDGHDFRADVPGTDSYRMQQAGACGTAVFSGNRVLIYKETSTSLERLIECFPESDLILVEGLKDTELLKFEIVRQGISEKPISNPVGRLGILTDIPELLIKDHKCRTTMEEMDTEIIHLNDMERLAERLIEMIKRGNV